MNIPTSRLIFVGRIGSETGTDYHRDPIDGSIWAECWGLWRVISPSEAVAEVLDWPEGYLAEVEAAPPDQDWATIERRRIAERRRLAERIRSGS